MTTATPILRTIQRREGSSSEEDGNSEKTSSYITQNICKNGEAGRWD